ncbi:MAG: HPr family phosphocarrier protein [Proteobacteria bacterium]|nr:HPr family phosphocarrier protein [Pseudomonadota bacterium]
MPSRTITIINKLGLHARAAAKFVQLASNFSCEINIKHGNREVSGKSIMGVMMLAAGMGTEIEIIANGADEKRALDALENLMLDGFGENE